MNSDIVPVTDFRKNTKSVLSKLTQAPIVLTQRSRPVAVLVDYASYNAQLKRLDELELLIDDHALNQAIDTAEKFVTLDELFADIISSGEETTA